jgi:hypothetical protein
MAQLKFFFVIVKPDFFHHTDAILIRFEVMDPWFITGRNSYTCVLSKLRNDKRCSKVTLIQVVLFSGFNPLRTNYVENFLNRWDHAFCGLHRVNTQQHPLLGPSVPTFWFVSLLTPGSVASVATRPAIVSQFWTSLCQLLNPAVNSRALQTILAVLRRHVFDHILAGSPFVHKQQTATRCSMTAGLHSRRNVATFTHSTNACHHAQRTCDVKTTRNVLPPTDAN